jgi:hypothetical protein
MLVIFVLSLKRFAARGTLSDDQADLVHLFQMPAQFDFGQLDVANMATGQSS